MTPVENALRERFENRPPWQEFVTLKAADLADECSIHPARIGNILGRMWRGKTDTPDGLRLVRIGTNNVRTQWRVEER